MPTGISLAKRESKIPPAKYLFVERRVKGGFGFEGR
jgi:hypothetical protein